MKKVFLILLVALTTGAFAQSTSKEDLDVIQGIYGKSKKELAVAYMAIPEAQSAAFWKIYDEFEIERKVLGKATDYLFLPIFHRPFEQFEYRFCCRGEGFIF